MEESFGLAIKEHLELQRRNRALEGNMPLAQYLDGGAVAPVAQEDTQEWVLPESATVLGHEPRLFPAAEEIWTGTPAFDWGD